ncbi:MAG: type II toxin-antitoxin system RelE/ParE family toxin [Flavobacteriales bacterium]
MKYKLHFTQAAKYDSKKAHKWYEEIRKGLGDRFRKELTSATNHLRQDPSSIQTRYRDVRIIFLKVFPYGVHYRIVENQVHILAVLHTSRKPKA